MTSTVLFLSEVGEQMKQGTHHHPWSRLSCQPQRDLSVKTVLTSMISISQLETRLNWEIGMVPGFMSSVGDWCPGHQLWRGALTPSEAGVWLPMQWGNPKQTSWLTQPTQGVEARPVWYRLHVGVLDRPVTEAGTVLSLHHVFTGNWEAWVGDPQSVGAGVSQQ